MTDRSIAFGITAELENVALVGLSVRAVCRANGMTDEGAADIELAVVEALTNIVRHGQGPADGRIRTKVRISRRKVVIEITDHGTPIPRERLDCPVETALAFNPATVPTGGRGIALIRLSVDAMTYESAEGVNRLRLTKRFGPAAETPG
ncbi:ATP-binding protein [Marinivivus vitaminiproducens]|uniref:ATP-binding protein n=1 Tax=Marinivivus vitaminiproducens TaxID=3035935 RepID=UPI00279CD130|nr:ATP-binding protein [Geminicoccaceae bacterium SCSIO 64248]